MNTIDNAYVWAKTKADKMKETFIDDERGDFAQYALLIIIVVAIAGILGPSLKGWVEEVMNNLTDFTVS